MSVLFAPEHRTRAADLQIAHGDFEAAAQFREFHDRLQPLARRFRHHLFRLEGEIGVREHRAAPHPAAQLVQLRNAQPVRIDDDEGVRLRKVDAVFDDGRGDEDVRFALVKLENAVFQHRFVHAAVCDADFALGNDLLDLRREAVDTLHAVVQDEHLPAPRQFAHAGVADERFRLLHHIRLHGQAVGRRRVDGADVADAREGHVQGTRNGRRRHREAVDVRLHVLDLFLMLDAEALFLVED